MNYYQIVAFAQHLKKENMNNNFMNDPNEFTTDVMNEDSLMNQYFDMIKGHDYSHMFSDDNRYYTAGVRSEKLIKEVLHSLIAICRVDAERLLEDSISEVKQQYNDKDSNGNDLTHRVIRGWFNPYVEDKGPEYDSAGFTKNDRIVKQSFKCVDGMYYAGDVFDIDGDGWVSEEQLELLLLEFNNGVK